MVRPSSFRLAGAVAGVALGAPVHAAPPAARQTATGIAVRTVEPWTDRIVHVRFGPVSFTGNDDPAGTAKPARPRFTVTDARRADPVYRAAARPRRQGDRRGQLRRLRRQPLPADARRRIGTAGTIQDFATRTPLFGLGQHQDGPIDHGGGTVYLRQKNGEVAVPIRRGVLTIGARDGRYAGVAAQVRFRIGWGRDRAAGQEVVYSVRPVDVPISCKAG